MAQVAAGHGNVTVDENFVFKKMHEVELDFFKKLLKLQKANIELQEIMPRIIEINGNEVKMSRVGQGLEGVKVCDVKIGFKTFSRQEFATNRHEYSLKKEFKMSFQDILKGSREIGFRIEGVSGEPKTDVYWKPKEKLKEFIGNDASLYQSIIEKLKKIKDIMARQDFAIIGSSVLIALDKSKKNMEIKLIDFAHPFYKSMDLRKFTKIQNSFLGGLDNLIHNIEDIKPKDVTARHEEYVNPYCDFDERHNMYWDYKIDDFELKQKDDEKPDIEEQNRSSARLWYHTIFNNLSPENANYNFQGEKVLESQKEIILRNICAMAVSVPLEGEQKNWSYKDDNTHSIAQLISGGGRFGYVFENDNVGKKFVNFLVSGDESKTFQKLIKDKLDFRGKKVPINEKGNVDMETTGKSHAGLYERVSTHSQKLIDGHFQEVKHFAKGISEAYGMNFPMGGVGNAIEGKNRSIIGYEGESVDGKHQLGTMILKFDSQQGKARLMCGFESSAPFRKNQMGANHGVISTIGKNFRRFVQVASYNLNLSEDSHKFLAKSRSLTGQSKGYEVGIYTSYGSNTAMITEDKFEKFKKLYSALKSMDKDNQRDFVKDILLSSNRAERENIYNNALKIGLKKEVVKTIDKTKDQEEFQRDGREFLEKLTSKKGIKSEYGRDLLIY